MELSDLPSISALADDPRLGAFPHAVRVRAARQVVAEARALLRAGQAPPAPQDDFGAQVLERARALRQPRLRPVINATGIPIHTNLGRAPLSQDAVAALLAVARGYSNVELDLATGRRGGRLAGIDDRLCRLAGADAALAVNNNAAAVLLVLTALARGREVIVSRGELVEIGGSFRVPEVIAAGGARLVEVGSTNRTRVADFQAAIGPDTALILRVHPSNFRIQGFTERPDRKGLVALGRQHGVPVVEDLGSGLFGRLPGATGGVDDAGEDAVDAAMAAGIDLACFSGDKLLGGPQAGLVVGRADLVEQCRAHPLYRALRLDKLVLAALEATLAAYDEDRADTVPIRQLLARGPDWCAQAAERIAAALPGARVEPDVGYSGGGAMPAQGLPTHVVAVGCPDPDGLALALRQGDPAIVARVARDSLLIDPRTLLDGEEAQLVSRLSQLLGQSAEQIRGSTTARTTDGG